MIHPAVALYHDLLLDRGDAAELAATFFDTVRARHLTFGDRLVCSVLRPYFISAADYRLVQRASARVMGAIARLDQALAVDARLRASVGLTADEEAIVGLPVGYRGPDVSARLDSFLAARDSLWFIEYNAESPGGLAFGDVLGETFAEFPVMRQVAQTYPPITLPIRGWTLDALLSVYRESGRTGRPNIAIVDWREVRTYNEFLIFQTAFETAGYPTRIVDPRDLEYRDGKLRAGDFVIDLVYKRVVTGELLAREGLGSPLVRAVADGAVCMANGFRAHLLLKKVLFAFLSDPQYDYLYTPDQRAAIANHVPWTRLVADGPTTYQGQRVDLLAFAADHRERLVLKPSGEYGGVGVILGWEASPAEWDAALRRALDSVYVIQERVPVPQEDFPVLDEGAVRLSPRYLDLDPYVWQGTRTAGCGVRLSGEALLNVSAGGGSAVPMYILQEA